MNKYELIKFINNIKIGDTFTNLHLEGYNDNDLHSILQELARKKKMQFQIEFSNFNYIYAVMEPSKKFINREGQWNKQLSKNVIEFLKQEI